MTLAQARERGCPSSSAFPKAEMRSASACGKRSLVRWLASGVFDPGVGWAMNDLGCTYETGPTYVCSDNAK